MTNFQFLQAYIALQKEIMFDEVIELDFATICYSQHDSSPFWNNALINSNLNQEQVDQAAQQLKQLQRKPAFYFEDRSDLQLITATLLEQNYQQIAADSFMFHSGAGIPDSGFDSIKKVNTPEELETFITSFDHCYRKDDPLNPYGELGEYLAAARLVWEKHHHSNRLEYFMAYDKSEPVAVAALTNYQGIGYISNVGSLLSVRGRGFGKLITQYCVKTSQNNGNTTHCLATEEGTNPNSFYKAIGFETKIISKLIVQG